MTTGTRTRDTITAAAVSGVCAGTTIMTLNGEVSVERLAPGARVITRDTGMAVLRAVSVRTVRTAPIRIKAGSLGHTRPDRDMIVPPGAQIHIRDWRAQALFGAPAATVAASRLVDGEFLAVQALQDMQVYTLTFDAQHIIYADGIEMASAAV
ncbi:Hint domain-containing protein [Loktanella atrilutea]|uniref:Hint domain-containing protein n=1 Tax=Loktanella atrilutea TaxID=366533 RepID=A0A1M4TXL1_LOKAT|nr:Hint domain-containing protein [Loktanella atrilutea]SHE49221.1 Hint domain-containing protein [Loktanella atrilutea]